MPYTQVPDRPVHLGEQARPASHSHRSSRVRFTFDDVNGSSSAPRSSESSKSSGSNRTLYERPRFVHDDDQYSLSSYRHPYDIPPPPNAHTAQKLPPPSPASPAKEPLATKVDLEMGCPHESEHPSAPIEDGGVLSSLVDNDEDNNWDNLDEQQPSSDEEDDGAPAGNLYEQVMDEDDPRVTGEKKNHMEDYDDLDDMMQKQMSYRERRKAARAVKIQYNVSCEFPYGLYVVLDTKHAVSDREPREILDKARPCFNDVWSPVSPHRVSAALSGPHFGDEGRVYPCPRTNNVLLHQRGREDVRDAFYSLQRAYGFGTPPRSSFHIPRRSS